jgi:hypothetical protein
VSRFWLRKLRRDSLEVQRDSVSSAGQRLQYALRRLVDIKSEAVLAWDGLDSFAGDQKLSVDGGELDERGCVRKHRPDPFWLSGNEDRLYRVSLQKGTPRCQQASQQRLRMSRAICHLSGRLVIIGPPDGRPGEIPGMLAHLDHQALLVWIRKLLYQDNSSIARRHAPDVDAIYGDTGIDALCVGHRIEQRCQGSDDRHAKKSEQNGASTPHTYRVSPIVPSIHR